MLTELITDLLSDFMQDSESLISVDQATRYLQRSLPMVCVDIDQAYQIDGDDVLPEMPLNVRELWLIRAKLMIVDLMIVNSASNADWKSNNKSMDSHYEPGNWQKLKSTLLAEYKTQVSKLNPDYDSDFVTPIMNTAGAERGIDGGTSE